MALFVDLIQKIRRGLDVEPLPVTQHHKCKIPGSNSGRAEKLIKILYLFPVHTDNLIPCLDPDPVCQLSFTNIDPLYGFYRDDCFTIIPGNPGIDDYTQDHVENDSRQNHNNPLPDRFAAELIGLWFFVYKAIIQRFINHHRDLNISAQRSRSDYIFGNLPFPLDDRRRKANCKSVNSHPKILGSNEMYELMHCHQNKNGGNENEECRRYT